MLLKTLFGMILIALLLLPAGKARAQTWLDTGSLQGQVTHDQGKAIPGAVIRAKAEHGVTSAESDANGNYRILFLTPGTYDVTISIEGNEVQLKRDVQVTSNNFTPLDAQLVFIHVTDPPNAPRTIIHATTEPKVMMIEMMAAAHELQNARTVNDSGWNICGGTRVDSSYVVPELSTYGYTESSAAMERFGWRSLQDIF